MPEPGVVRRFARGTQSMRIGERLVQDGLVTPEQLAQGLRVQAEQGSRLGSTLIDLGYLDQDFLARYLGHHHGMPPALSRHFDLRDPVLPTRLSAELAARWGVIPLARLVGDQQRILVAVADPLPPAAVDQIATAMGCQIISAITAEIRVHHYLERIYGIPRTDIAPRPGSPSLPILFTDEDVECELLVHLDGDPLDSAGHVPTGIERAGEDAYLDAIGDAIELDLDLDINDAESVSRSQATSTRVDPSTSAGTSRPASEDDAPDIDAVPREIPDTDSSRATLPIAVAKLGRISLKRVGAPAEQPAKSPGISPIESPTGSPAESLDRPPADMDEVLRALRRATGRDKVGDLIVGALHDLFDQMLDAGAVLALRGTRAMGWKGFVRHGRRCDAMGKPGDKIDIPLGTPSLVGGACRSRQIFVGPAPAAPCNTDHHLWTALGAEPPRTVAVAPVILETRLACVLYAHTRVEPERALPVIEEPFAALASAMATAFERLLRAARR